MLESLIVDMPQYNVYHHSVHPIVSYVKEHRNSVFSEHDLEKLLPYAKQTDFILSTFHEIIDDLNYDKEKFEKIIYTFDDDYDMLKDFTSQLNPVIKSHNELLKMSEKILSNLIKAQNELGIVISQHEHSRV